MAFAAAFLVILLAAPAVLATDFPVKWTLGDDYSSWATKSVNVGDKLVFTYDNTHTVTVASKSDYDNCDSSNALQTNTKSPTTITLKEGPTYIICGTPGHCAGGMKLQVTTKGSGSSGSSPSTPTPSGSTPTPSGTKTPSSTPSAAGSSSAGHLVYGIPLVLGALFAFMG